MAELQSLIDRIIASYPSLSPQLRRAAQHMVDHQTEVALSSMRAVAEAASLPPSTLVRLARSLGFENYEALREPFRETVRRERTGYSDRAEDLQAEADQASLHDRIAEEQVKNLRRAFHLNEDQALRAAADALVKARRIGVIGGLAGFGIAQYVTYVGRLAFPNMTMLSGADGPEVDALADLDKRDVVLAFSLAPYNSATVKSLRLAATLGATVIAVTDSAVSPLARGATHVLTTPTRSPHFFPSYAPALAVLEALLAQAVSRGGPKLLGNIRRSEEARQTLGVYWSED